jgi:ribosomal-protein-alanine N-acetyltransferase
MSASGADVRIRRMAAADVERVMEIEASLRDAPHWPVAAYRSAMDPEDVPRRIALVAEQPDPGVVFGFAVVSIVGPQAELETIAVAAKGQRRGVGTRLFWAMAEECLAAQVTDVNLEVRASNAPALALYRALGFLETGRRPRYYSNPEEDAVLMGLGI